MADISWLVCRLKAMSIPEIAWRVSQKIVQNKERNRFEKYKTVVTACLFDINLEKLQLDADRLHLNLKNKNFQLHASIPLLGGYCYDEYKNKWNAGFQTDNHWPEEFSYSIKYKQRDDIGDARTNWELNRHFQFAVLAKNYFASSDAKYLKEFECLFDDWNNMNPFLWGISWTSVMEVAIRCSNWCYAYCFLVNTNASQVILDKLRVGIINMADYIARHYSRYSSANNHLIVEAYAIGQVGILCNHKPWISLAVKILTRELVLQNYSDGINKELSLHYQSFYMEAMGLLMRLMTKNNIDIPRSWKTMLNKMCKYMSTCTGNQGEMVVFGDDDEGKILDLQGGLEHCPYVLGLFSCLLDKKYIPQVKCCENLAWLFSDAELNRAQKKELFIPKLSTCYTEGGNTILRSRDGRILIGIDHAALGFGSIAAHGHADALSFQMFIDGYPLFIDPGTYIYHCDLKSRNAFRRTQNHNTVCIDGKDQSEMLGAFLWGKKAECKLLEFSIKNGETRISASHNGYENTKVVRKYAYNGGNKLEIEDDLSGTGTATGFFIMNPSASLKSEDNKAEIVLGNIKAYMRCSEKLEIRETEYSIKYGTKGKTSALVYVHNVGDMKSVLTSITIEAP